MQNFTLFRTCVILFPVSLLILGTYKLIQTYEAAIRGLTPVKGPLPVKFPIPDPRDWFSLKPGSIAVHFPKSKGSEVQTSSNLNAAIAGARAAATQFSKKDQNSQTGQTSTTSSVRTRQMTRKLVEDDENVANDLGETSNSSDLTSDNEEKRNQTEHEGSSSDSQSPCPNSRPQSGAPSKVCRFFLYQF